MDDVTDLNLALPGLRASRATIATRRTVVKEHYGVGRVERGTSEWWGGGRAWRSAPGCIVVKQPGDVVRPIAYGEPLTVLAVQLPAEDIARARRETSAVLVAQLEAGDARAAPFHRLLDAVNAGADRLALEVALAEAVGALATIGATQPAASRPVRRAMEYIRAELARAITLDDLAAHADLDKFHLCRAFRAQVGMSPYAYLTHRRVSRAKELLRQGLRASDVAPRVGFYDQAKLTHHFRLLVGTTPARYGRADDRGTDVATVARR